MSRSIRWTLAALALLLSPAIRAVECGAQEPAPRRWSLVTHNQLQTVRLWRDGIVTEPDGTRTAWMRIENKEKYRHYLSDGQLSPEINVAEHRFRFDCAGKLMQLMETRELLDDAIVHEHVAGPGAEWKQPYMFSLGMNAIFRRVC